MSQHNAHARDHQGDDDGGPAGGPASRAAAGPTVGPAGSPGGADGEQIGGPGGLGRRLRARLRAGCGSADLGMATAEYAIATVAAVGFAGLLIAILRSDEVRELLLGIIRGALST